MAEKYILKGVTTFMNTSDDSRGKLSGGVPVSFKEVEQMKTQMKDIQIEIA